MRSCPLGISWGAMSVAYRTSSSHLRFVPAIARASKMGLKHHFPQLQPERMPACRRACDLIPAGATECSVCELPRKENGREAASYFYNGVAPAIASMLADPKLALGIRGACSHPVKVPGFDGRPRCEASVAGLMGEPPNHPKHKRPRLARSLPAGGGSEPSLMNTCCGACMMWCMRAMVNA
jgi:hypothetical protein